MKILERTELFVCPHCGKGDGMNSQAEDVCIDGWNGASGPWYDQCGYCDGVYSSNWQDPTNRTHVVLDKADESDLEE